MLQPSHLDNAIGEVATLLLPFTSFTGIANMMAASRFTVRRFCDRDTHAPE